MRFFSFGTLVVNLRTTERQGGEETDALRNLVDLNMRALHINSAWDGDNGSSRYLSLYEVEALGQNDVPPEYVPGLDSDVRYEIRQFINNNLTESLLKNDIDQMINDLPSAI